MSETLPMINELLGNLPVVSMTISRVFRDVASTHSELALLSLGGTSRPPPQGPPGISLPVNNFTGAWVNTSTYISCKFMSSFIIHSTSCQHTTGTALWESSPS